ncbi:glycosyltransferase family 9 protein [Fulvivirga sp. 29W222]|uniref:Glycosyltransferase family 9 protein n=1 Tax=Fulvivirga marina TaxID=2494733 RepID=A0A937G032_9BACT|nr:glycosyltransferase family 9 protein [Fulvivirga marina]MBL6449335.1 glycosyltransferase family 9 protein [Fulvivirga marina]
MEKKKSELVLVSWGGIGDAIVCTPTLRELKRQDPKRKIILYHLGPKHYSVFKHNPYIDSLRSLKTRTLMKHPVHFYKYLHKRKHRETYTYLFFQPVAPTHIYRKSVKNIVADIFDLKLEDDKVEIFLTEEEERNAKERLSLFKTPVIVHVHSRSSQNHHWELEKWNALVESLPEYDFIQVGNTDEQKVEGAIDWRGKSTLREAFALLKYASSFVGVDSSLSHVTNAFGTKGVVLFGDSTPVFWGHDNNLNIYKGVSCSPCFYYLFKNKCIYNHECMDMISVDEVRQALIKQVGRADQSKIKTAHF